MKLFIVLGAIVWMANFDFLFNSVESTLYEINLDALEPRADSDSSFFDYGTFRITRKGRNQFVISGSFEFFQNMDDNTKFMYESFLNEDNIPFMVGEKGFCQGLNSNNKIARRIRELSDLPPAGTCPFPKGRYTIDNYELDESQLPVMIPPGRYTCIIKMVQDGQVKAGYKVKVTIQ